MKRYGIFEKEYKKTTERKNYLKVHPQTLMEFAKNVNFGDSIHQESDLTRDEMVSLLASMPNSQSDEYFNRMNDENSSKIDFFAECNEKILSLYNVEAIALSEEEMYETILLDILQMPEVSMDINSHIYYTILYQKTEGKYTNLLQDNWTKDEKADFTENRKKGIRYKNKPNHYIPFQINENRDRRITIQDFAPDLVRLYYTNKELRNIFTDTQAADTVKYYSTEISSVYQSPYICVDRVEEIWLLERILGINLARAMYSLLLPIMPKNFSLVASKYQPLIREIVHEIMKLQGIYSRCVLVHKLKEIVKIRRYGHEIEQLEPCETLTYLKQLLKDCMNSISEEFAYREYTEYQMKKDITEKVLDSLRDNCRELLDIYFHVEKGYFILNENESSIKNESLYSLIQKVVISELKK